MLHLEVVCAMSEAAVEGGKRKRKGKQEANEPDPEDGKVEINRQPQSGLNNGK